MILHPSIFCGKEIGNLGMILSIDYNLIRLYFIEYNVTSLSSLLGDSSNGYH